ncbi:hypothetical protein GCM10007147_21870 [Nocardiopsis kunsanensis]|uniref:Uncharacterized protein n=1 Tax=Nocardiopsis kunsanensis TaxID=141693 RepID=A0A918XC77_9ACTN|nr:hypothetical protein GCM10007147_21870 [Nocardiopsis kunsanensis]
MRVDMSLGRIRLSISGPDCDPDAVRGFGWSIVRSTAEAPKDESTPLPGVDGAVTVGKGPRVVGFEYPERLNFVLSGDLDPCPGQGNS